MVPHRDVHQMECIPEHGHCARDVHRGPFGDSDHNVDSDTIPGPRRIGDCCGDEEGDEQQDVLPDGQWDDDGDGSSADADGDGPQSVHSHPNGPVVRIPHFQ